MNTEPEQSEKEALQEALLRERVMLGRRLKWARERLKMSQKTLGAKIGISQQGVQKVENGEIKKPEFLKEAATALEIPFDWLIGKAHFNEVLNQEIENRAFIHEISSTGETIEPPWSIPPTAIGLAPSALSGLEIREVIGDAMFPDLRSGDYALVNTSDVVPSPAGLFMIHDGHGLQIRRIESIASKKLRVSASNPSYSPFDASPEEVTIYGRIILKVSRV